MKQLSCKRDNDDGWIQPLRLCVCAQQESHFLFGAHAPRQIVVWLLKPSAPASSAVEKFLLDLIAHTQLRPAGQAATIRI